MSDAPRFSRNIFPDNVNLLLGCLLIEASDIKGSRLKSYTYNEWKDITLLAGRHGLGPILYWQIKDYLLQLQIPENVKNSLHKSLLVNAGRNQLFFFELGKLLRSFHHANIPVIVLKGAHLAEIVYPHIALRTMGDVDLFVKQQDIQSADGVLHTLGYKTPYTYDITGRKQRGHHAPPYEKKNAPVIELHWLPVSPRKPWVIPMNRFWELSRQIDIADAKAFGLIPEAELVYLCIHMSAHDFRMGLRPVYDMIMLIQSHAVNINWDLVVQITIEWNAQKPVYLSLRLAQELFGATIPAEILTMIQPQDLSVSVLCIAREEILHPTNEVPMHPYLIGLGISSPLLDRIKLVREILIIPPSRLAFIYNLPDNSPFVFLYYPVRLFGLLKVVINQILSLLNRRREGMAFFQSQRILRNWWYE